MGAALVASTIQAVGANGGATTGINTTGASLIVLSVTSFSASSATPSDSAGNTWTAGTARVQGINRCQQFWCTNPVTSSSHTFTYTFSSGQVTVAVQAFSGAGAFEAQSGAAGGSLTSIQPGALTPAEAGAILVSAVGCNVGTSPSVGSGFATPITVANSSGHNECTAASYLIQSPAAAVNPTWSWTGSTTAATSMLVFAPAAGGPFPFFIQPDLNGGLWKGGI